MLQFSEILRQSQKIYHKSMGMEIYNKKEREREKKIGFHSTDNRNVSEENTSAPHEICSSS